MAAQWAPPPPSAQGYYPQPIYPQHYPPPQYQTQPNHQYPQHPIQQQYPQPQQSQWAYQAPPPQQYGQEQYGVPPPIQQNYPSYQGPAPHYPPVATSVHHSGNCYNCGSLEHVAQGCPEPRRDIPTGATSKYAHPKKVRPHYIPPVVTKYAVPPHVQASLDANLQAQSNAYGAPVPRAGIAATYNTPPQQYPAAGLAPSHSPGYVQHPQWQAPQASPQLSVEEPYSQNLHQYSHSPPANGQVGAQPRYGRHLVGTSSIQWRPNQGRQSLPRASAEKSMQPPSPTISQAQHTRHSSPASSDQSVSMKSESEPPEAEETETDEIELLDQPEDIYTYGGQDPQLVRFALPSLSDSDQVGLFPKPLEESGGVITSRFLKNQNLDAIMTNIQDTDDFESRKDDPIFRVFTTEKSDMEKRVRSRSPGRTIGQRRSESYNNKVRNNNSAAPNTNHRRYDRGPTSPANPRQDLWKSYRRDTPRRSRSRSRSPVRCDTNVSDHRQRSPTPDRKFAYRKNVSNYDPFDPDADEDPYEVARDGEPGSGVGDVAPPPPPPPPGHPPFRRHSSNARNHQSKFSPSDTPLQNVYPTPQSDHSYGPGQDSSSPNSARQRKRNHADNEVENERRRQQDDVASRQKKSQPRVAAAYSRRW